jgi:hypothetical protein
MARHTEPVADEAIGQKIHVIRGQRVLLDSDLAALYGVATTRFNEAVARNANRFPGDFMFALSNQVRAMAAVATCRAPSPNMGPSWLPLS